MDDPQQLERFVVAQAGGAYERALVELCAGRKSGHWMWFVFPQLRGLGVSPTARRFAISGLEQARAYLAHPVLGPRLSECCAALMGLGGGITASSVLGGVDAMKLRSSMTLFMRTTDGESIYGRVLDRYYGGAADDLTDRLLADGR